MSRRPDGIEQGRNVMKKLLTVVACLAFAGALQAQSILTQGNPYASNMKTGNRPGAGDWGLYIGPSNSEIMDMRNSFNKLSGIDVVRGLPLVNVKYYTSDRFELRGGLQYYKRGYRSEGTEFVSNVNQLVKESDWFFRIVPGFAYHFSQKNVLDVYAGASLPLGFEGATSKSENPTVITNAYYKSLCAGLEAFIGLQAFVADLPLSIGLEYGFGGMFHTGQKIKHEFIDASNIVQTTYSDLKGNLNYKDDFKANSGIFGSDFRFTITYYFNNK